MVADYQFCGSCIIDTLLVQVGITHAEVGDLKVALIAPNDEIVGLLDRPGTTSPTGPGFATDLNGAFPIIFNDASPLDPEQLGSNGITPQFPDTIVRSFGPFPAANGNPEATLSLSSLSGRQATGLWTIVVADELAQLSGSVVSADLLFTCA